MNTKAHIRPRAVPETKKCAIRMFWHHSCKLYSVKSTNLAFGLSVQCDEAVLIPMLKLIRQAFIRVILPIVDIGGSYTNKNRAFNAFTLIRHYRVLKPWPDYASTTGNPLANVLRSQCIGEQFLLYRSSTQIKPLQHPVCVTRFTPVLYFIGKQNKGRIL